MAVSHPAASSGPIAFGVGTRWMKQDHSSDVDTNVVAGVRRALDVGYRHFDSAQMYGTERELGIAVAESGIPRAEVFITAKTLDLDNIEVALEQILANLKTDYVDLFLIHAPFFAKDKQHIQDAWRGMNRCVKRGLARHIGVSSFQMPHLQVLLDLCKIDKELVPPSVNQIEIHPLLPQPGLLAFMKDNDIAAEGFASLLPLTFSPASPEESRAKEMVTSCAADLAKKYGAKSASSVLLRYTLDRDAIVVTTSSKEERLAGYLSDTQGFTLSKEDLSALEAAAGGVQVRNFFGEEVAEFEQTGSIVS